MLHYLIRIIKQPPNVQRSNAHDPPNSIPLPTYDIETKHTSVRLIVAVVISVAAFIGLSIIFFFKICSDRVEPRRPSPQNSFVQDEINEDDDENQEPIHHIWYIATPGLGESVINSITACKYNRNEGLIDGNDCSVCLTEFRDGDDIRLLPKCSHAFHLPCIDTWLRSHVNCPLCRAPIVSNASSSCPPCPDQDSSDVRDGTLEVNSEIGDALARNQSRRIDEDQQVEEDLNSDAEERIRELEAGKGETGMASTIVDPHDGLSRFRIVSRSFSMDSSASAMRASAMDTLPKGLVGGSSAAGGQLIAQDKLVGVGMSLKKKSAANNTQGVLKMLSACSRGSFLLRPVLMKRSLSLGCKLRAPKFGRRNPSLPL